LARNETFAGNHKTTNFVIPADPGSSPEGIQFFQALPGFRVKPGMTEKGMTQVSSGFTLWHAWVRIRQIIDLAESSGSGSPCYRHWGKSVFSRVSRWILHGVDTAPLLGLH